MDNDELRGNPRLRDYLQSAGTLIPSDAGLMVEWGDSKEGAKVIRQFGCIFCNSADASIDPMTNNVTWVYKWASKTVKKKNDFSKTPYRMCWDCYQHVRELSEFRSKLYQNKFFGAVIAYRNNSFMTSRLENYLDSKGLILPGDWTEYTDRGKHEGKCLFCQSIPGDYPVKRYNGFLSVTTKCKCCDDCWLDVRDMEEALTAGELFGVNDLDLHEALRISNFVRKAEFDETVESHFQHLPMYPNDSPVYKTGHFVENCYFCKEYVDSSYVLVNVPVTSSDSFSGGKVRCCKQCQERIKNMRLTDPHALKEDMFIPQICDSCGTDYEVTLAEMKVRQQYDTIGAHMCPACTFQRAYETDDDNFKPEMDLRYKEFSCKICGETFFIDLTLSRSYIKTKNVTKNAEFCCSICANSGNFSIFAVKDGLWTIRFHTANKGFVVRFFRGSSSNPSETISIQDTGAEDALLLAFEHIKTDLT